jgi:hypothetical protein
MCTYSFAESPRFQVSQGMVRYSASAGVTILTPLQESKAARTLARYHAHGDERDP